MKRKTLCICTLFTLLIFSKLAVFSSPLYAETITLETALKKAIENNPDLKKQRLSLEDAKRRKNNVWNKFLPSLNASAGYSNTHDFMDLSAAPDAWNWKVSGSASLSFTFALPSSIRQQILNYEKEQLAYENLEAKTLSSVATSFYSLIAEQKNLQILEDSQSLAKQVYEQTLKNYRSGLASELDMLKSKYSYSSIEPQIEEAESSYYSDLSEFALSLGYDISEIAELKLEGELKTPQITFEQGEKLVERYLDNRYDVKSAEIAVEQAKISKMTTVSNSQLPSLNFSENLSYAQNTTDKMNGSFSASVTIPLSTLIPGSAESLNVKTQNDAIASARITADETRKSAENDILTKFSNISRIWKSLEVAKLNESISERSYELSKEGYNAGLVSQTDLESSRQQFVSSQQTVLQSQISYLSSLYSASQAINVSIEEFFQIFATAQEESK
ncbi:MAG: TolC family protein [Treponemataceae bacterium]|nr:TolC family protein [Spirochaetales bacterium]MDY6030830.1 TolC family protein [Treponemataceae bacterium]